MLTSHINRYYILKVALVPLVVVLMAVSGGTLKAQPYSINNGWMMGAGAGMVSFYGDLSVHDLTIGEKINTESNPATYLFGGKLISPVFSVKTSLLNGKMRGSNEDFDQSFTNHFYELSLSGSMCVTELMFPDNKGRLDIFVTGGLGYIHSLAVNSQIVNEKGLLPVSTETAALAKIISLEVQYSLSRRLRICGSLSSRYTNSDMIDGYTGSTGINDHYTFHSLGVVYVMNSSVKGYYAMLPCSPW